MVQVKLSVAFILAAASIASVAARPVEKPKPPPIDIPKQTPRHGRAGPIAPVPGPSRQMPVPPKRTSTDDSTKPPGTEGEQSLRTTFAERMIGSARYPPPPDHSPGPSGSPALFRVTGFVPTSPSPISSPHPFSSQGSPQGPPQGSPRAQGSPQGSPMGELTRTMFIKEATTAGLGQNPHRTPLTSVTPGPGPSHNLRVPPPAPPNSLATDHSGSTHRSESPPNSEATHHSESTGSTHRSESRSTHPSSSLAESSHHDRSHSESSPLLPAGSIHEDSPPQSNWMKDCANCVLGCIHCGSSPN